MSLRSELTIHYVHILSLLQAIHSFKSYCLLLVICFCLLCWQKINPWRDCHSCHALPSISCFLSPPKIMIGGVFQSNRIMWCQKTVLPVYARFKLNVCMRMKMRRYIIASFSVLKLHIIMCKYTSHYPTSMSSFWSRTRLKDHCS